MHLNKNIKNTILCIFLIAQSLFLANPASGNTPAWTNAPLSTKGAGYDPLAGHPVRKVVDFEVPGAVGAYPLKVSRTLAAYFNEVNSLRDSDWQFDYRYTLYFINNFVAVNFPNGVSYVFVVNPSYPEEHVEFKYYGHGHKNKLIWNKEKFILVKEDGGKVEFSKASDPDVNQQFGTKIIDPNGLVTQVSHYGVFGLSKVIGPTGRWIKFHWKKGGGFRPQLTSATSSAGQLVTYTSKERTRSTITSLPMRIVGAQYQDGSQASYRFSGPNESCNFNLPLELNDVRALSKMQHVKYEYSHQQHNCYIENELSPDGHIVSTLEPGSWKLRSSEDWPDGSRVNLQMNSGLVTRRVEYENYQTQTTPNNWYFDYDSDAKLALSQVTDPLERVTKIVNEPVLGKPTKTIFADGSSTSITYTNADKPFFIASETNELGRETFYDRLDNGVIYRIRYPDGSQESWGDFNQFNQPGYHILRNGATEYFEYGNTFYPAPTLPLPIYDPIYPSDYGQLKTHWLPSFNGKQEKIQYGYHDHTGPWNGLLAYEIDPLGRKTEYRYHESSTGTPLHGLPLVTKVTYHDGSSIQNSYDTKSNLLSETNELGQTTHYTYDSYNRMTSKIDALNRKTSYNYKKHNLQYADQSTFPLPSIVTSPLGKRVNFEYDSKGRVTRMDLGEGNFKTFEYDSVGNLIKQTDEEGRVTSYVYDLRDRLLSKTEPGDRTTQNFYDLLGNLIKVIHPDGESTHASYDEMGNKHTNTDELGKITEYEYNLSGQVKKITNPLGNTFTYEYDAQGRVIERTTPGRFAGTRVFEKLTYDAAGNISTREDNRGVQTTFDYDERNRLVYRDYSDGTPSVSLSYDLAGRLTEIISEDVGTSVTRNYDSVGQVKSERQTIRNNITQTVSYEYNKDGNIISTNQPYGKVRYHYNNRNQLTWAFQSLDPGGVLLPAKSLVAYEYFDDGQRRKKTLGNDNYESYSYDSSGRPKGFSPNFISTSNSRLPSKSYTYDKRNRPVSIKTTNASDYSIVEVFRYQSDSQLVKFYRQKGALTSGGSIPFPPWTLPPGVSYKTEFNVAFSYDDAGNRISNSVQGTYTVNGANEYTGISGAASDTFTYDDAGNLATKNGWTYQYDAEWRLTEAKSSNEHWQFYYDGTGRLNSIIENGLSRYAIYQGDKPVTWYDHNYNVIEHTIWGPKKDEPIYTKRPNGTSFYYHLDLRNNTIATSNESGTLLEQYIYDAFGKPNYYGNDLKWTKKSSSTVKPSHMYTGQLWFNELSLYHFRARFYDPKLGRFMQQDPMGIEAGDLNLYRYANNTPTVFVDPSGNIVETAWDAANVAMGVASFVNNVASGNYLAASVDAVGVMLDSAATVVPFVPAGAGTTIKIVRGADTAIDSARASSNIVDAGAAADKVANLGQTASKVKVDENVAKRLANVPGRVQSRINVSNDGWAHTLKGHFNPAKSNKSQFTISQGKLKSILSDKSIIQSPARQLKTGNFGREITLDRQVGNLAEKWGGGSTNTFSIVTDSAGNLLTATPGKL